MCMWTFSTQCTDSSASSAHCMRILNIETLVLTHTVTVWCHWTSYSASRKLTERLQGYIWGSQINLCPFKHCILFMSCFVPHWWQVQMTLDPKGRENPVLSGSTHPTPTFTGLLSFVVIRSRWVKSADNILPLHLLLWTLYDCIVYHRSVHCLSQPPHLFVCLSFCLFIHLYNFIIIMCLSICSVVELAWVYI